MPRGTLVWFDDRSGEGLIRRDGHEYPVRSAEIEAAARVPHAKVMFDIRRRAGVEWAVNVTLRRGTRVSPLQHRFGDLAGAHHPDEKGHHPLTDDREGVDWSFEGKPVELIEEWVRLLSLEDFPTLRLLYAPQVALHIGSERVVGRDAVIDQLVEKFAGESTHADVIRGHDDLLGLELMVGSQRHHVDFEIAHGRVVEQWMRS